MQNDPFLKHYGVSIEPSFTRTDARVLPPPTLHFRQGSVSPQFQGRWIIQGKKLWKENTAPLASWGMLVLESCVPYPALDAFSKTFTQVFKEHGGKVTAPPMLLQAPANIANNGAEAVLWAYEQLLAKTGYPQMLFVVVGQRNSKYPPSALDKPDILTLFRPSLGESQEVGRL